MNAAPTIDALRDIHMPPPPGLWPPAPGWWFVATVVALIAAAWWIRRHRRRAPLRAALRELEALSRRFAGPKDAVALASGISRLLRRYAVWRFPDCAAAGLTDADWLAFLDARGGKGAFSAGPGAVLVSLPYRATGNADVTALVALARRWLEGNAP